MAELAAVVVPRDADSGPCACRFHREAPEHHDRLLTVELDPLGRVLELVELAATWHELEWTDAEPRIAPRDWIEFAAVHGWQDERIGDLFVALASLSCDQAVADDLAPVVALFGPSPAGRASGSVRQSSS
jgi:hypothetical protein